MEKAESRLNSGSWEIRKKEGLNSQTEQKLSISHAVPNSSDHFSVLEFEIYVVLNIWPTRTYMFFIVGVCYFQISTITSNPHLQKRKKNIK